MAKLPKEIKVKGKIKGHITCDLDLDRLEELIERLEDLWATPFPIQQPVTVPGPNINPYPYGEPYVRD
jgi:alkanesulfonate monooxygenase SsuD/methylene tetrahydromethanopterin reductase-like flavin-dependent oxidoreductase (luciferase family)